MQFIALLRGINVGGHNKIPMADLRSACGELGWEDVRTYIQSGNLILKAGGPAAGLENELEQAIAQRFGLSISVIVRTGADWARYVADNPFPEESITEPNFVQLGLSKATPKSGAAEELQSRAAHGERVVLVGDGLWIHYPAGVGKSKLSPALVDRVVGSPVTGRNWRTVLKVNEMVGNT